MNDGPGTLTVLLESWRGGDRAALDAIVPLVYQELHRLAGSHLRGERAGHTFRPTDLVGEAYLRLADGSTPDFANRAHFFGIAARTMRQILVDHARKRSAAKRGNGERAVELTDGMLTTDRPEAMIALDDALAGLAKFDERKARTIELAHFGGMTQTEIAEALGVHINTVARDQKLAEAWIHRYLRDELP